MFSLTPRFTFTHPENSLARTPSQARNRRHTRAAARRSHFGRLVRQLSETSYWLGGAIEMAAINTILIIVNSATP
jgi:hypothetical protein